MSSRRGDRLRIPMEEQFMMKHAYHQSKKIRSEQEKSQEGEWIRASGRPPK